MCIRDRYYYRDRNAKEIDIVIECDGEVHPIEIKKTASPNLSMTRSFSVLDKSATVSYTHLDVYKRHVLDHVHAVLGGVLHELELLLRGVAEGVAAQGDDSGLAVALFVSHRFHLNLSVNQPISLLGCM